MFLHDLDLVLRSHTVILGATLSARDGHVHVPPGHLTSTACVSGTPSTGQCDMCCYGNGACNVGTCECDPGFSDSDNCGELLVLCYQKKAEYKFPEETSTSLHKNHKWHTQKNLLNSKLNFAINMTFTMDVT